MLRVVECVDCARCEKSSAGLGIIPLRPPLVSDLYLPEAESSSDRQFPLRDGRGCRFRSNRDGRSLWAISRWPLPLAGFKSFARRLLEESEYKLYGLARKVFLALGSIYGPLGLGLECKKHFENPSC
jgi:hypothetical protein